MRHRHTRQAPPSPVPGIFIAFALVPSGFRTGAPFLSLPPPVVEVFETPQEIEDGKRRRAYPDLDVVYYFRETKENLDALCLDFLDDAPVDNRDWFEKLCPCIFRGIPPV